MDERSALVIGAGVAGLAAGCYLRMNGYSVRILEMGHNAGGVSVSWKRGDYVFDGATNWIPGSAPSLNFHRILSEIIDFSKLDLINPDEFEAVETRDGIIMHVYTDADRLRTEMLRIAPEDRSLINEFIAAIRQVAQQRLPVDKPSSLLSMGELVRLGLTSLPLLLFVLKWRPVTIKAFAARFKSRAMQEIFIRIFLHHDFFSVLGLINSLGWMNMRSAGYPIGGSNAFIGALERRCRLSGCTIEFGAKVGKIIAENGSVHGVEINGGRIINADLVISACDGHDTLFSMLKGTVIPAGIRKAYDQNRVFPSYLQISLGIARSFEKIPHKIMLPLDPPLQFGTGDAIDYMMVRLCTFDPTLAPPGKTPVIVHLRTSDAAYWIRLRNEDRILYRQEKNRAAEAVIAALDRRLGGVAEAVEVTDVSTPATIVRYTNNWQGSYQGWAPTPALIGRSLPRTIEGVRGFYMCGQWVDPPGGLPRSIISARMAVQTICRDHGRRFTTDTSQQRY